MLASVGVAGPGARLSTSRYRAALAGRSALPAEDGGAHPALDQLYRSERDNLLRYVSRQAGPERAADLVQDVFVRALGSGQTDQLANPGGFLRRIARNLVIDGTRRTARRPVLLPLDEALDAPHAAEQEPALAAKDLLRSYERAVAELPEKTRRVFLMHRVEELTYREIHAELGISVATVEYHMMKALAHLARTLDAAQ